MMHNSVLVRPLGSLTAMLMGAITVVLLAAPAAVGHDARCFDSCAAHRRHGGDCTDTATFRVGDPVFLRAKVLPPHGRQEARVVFLRPGADRWRGGVTVPISDGGRMRWAFRTSSTEVGAEPWLFRFRIRGHGRSDVTEVLILPHGS